MIAIGTLTKDKIYVIGAIETNTIAIAGFTYENILKLRSEYEKRGGTLPITDESIEAVFNRGAKEN